jgi:phosphate transport system substrate-binding protein
MSKRIIKLLAISINCFILIIGCKSKPYEMVSPTTGKIKIAVDENLKDIIEQEKQIFESIYKYAQIELQQVPENTLINTLYSDSVKTAFIARSLSQEEMNFFKQRSIYPRLIQFATGALAFIVSSEYPDSAYTYESFLSLLSDPKRGKHFIIENNKSGIASQILQIIGKDTLPSNFYAKQTKNEIYQYIRQDLAAIGIIDYSDISDSDLPSNNQLFETTKLLAIARPKDSVQHGYIKPYQYNLQDRLYPFTRDLYFVSTSGLNDVGMGFIAFVAGEIGQKIVLKSGLLPKYQSERWIELKSSPKPVIER